MTKLDLNDLMIFCYSGIPFIIQLLLAILKMSGIVTWSWVVVLIPLWIYIAGFIGAVTYFFIDIARENSKINSETI